MKEKVKYYYQYIIEHIRNTFRFKSIQYIITFSTTSITVLAMLVVGILLFNRFANAAEQNAAINTRQVINQVNLNLDNYLRSMMEISDSLKDLVDLSKDISDSQLAEKMNVIIGTRKDIVNLVVFSKEGELLVGIPKYQMKERTNIIKQDWFKAPLDEPQTLFFSSPHVQNIFEGQHSWVVTLSREVTYVREGKKSEGVLIVEMNFRTIDQLCQSVSLGKKGYIYIVDSKGDIVYHPQQQLINNGLKTENVEEVLTHVFGRYFDKYNGENRLITIETVNYSRWRIVGIAYMDEIVTTKNDIWIFFVLTLVFGVCFVIFLSIFISSRITKPLKNLEKSMEMVKVGDFDINLEVKGDTEISQLSNSFNIMVARIRNLMIQNVHEQEAKRKSELNALQAQINPHFLYNTLDSIVWMAENEKMQDVITMILALAKLFRISISRGRNIITVQEELEHARNYMIIQKIRYKNKFEFKIESEQQVLQYNTVKLILQPLIENALYHGIEYMVDKGLITISVAEVNGKLLFQVKDNGLGMKPEILENLLAYESSAKEEGRGVGVKNVHERIQLMYGKNYGLEVESEREVGTNVKIWLEIQRDKKSEGGAP